MRLRLSDAVTSAVLAEHYRTQAEMCHQMARMTLSPFKEGWLEFAAEWTKCKRKRQSLLSQKCPLTYFLLISAWKEAHGPLQL